MGNTCCGGNTQDQQENDTQYAILVRAHREKSYQVKEFSNVTFQQQSASQITYSDTIQQQFTNKFTDKDFPPNKTSLINDWNDPDPEVQESAAAWYNIEWIRAADIPELNDNDGQLQVFSGGIEPNDIQQRELGDCYFLSSLSVIAERPDRIKQLFESEKTIPEGIYAINITKNGKKSHIVVDDYIPCKNKKVIFSHAHGNELWVILMEKAWAKIHGSYERIIGGQAHETLRDITGAPAWEYLSSDQQTWDRIIEADQKGYIMAAGVSADNQEQAEYFQNLGLVNGHAYGLIGCAEVYDRAGNFTKIVNVRNPWGSFEWKGDWSDNSPCWTEQAKKQVNLKSIDDGSFWMDLDNFVQCFSRIQICKYDDNMIFSHSNELQFTPRSCYQLIKMKIEKSGKYTIALSQKDERCYQRHHGYEYQNCRIIVMQLLNNQNCDEGVEFIRGDKGFMQRDTYIELENLQKGSYYILIDMDIDPNTFINQPEMYINSYGHGIASFTVETELYKKEQILELSFKSKFKQDPSFCKRTDFSQNGFPNIVRYTCTDAIEGYMFTIVENKEKKRTYSEDVSYNNQGLDLLNPWDKNEKDIIISGNSYQLTAAPGSFKMIFLRAQVAGYSMSCSQSISLT